MDPESVPTLLHKPRAYPTKKGRREHRRPLIVKPPDHLMGRIGLHGQVRRFFKVKTPTQVQLVDFSFLDLGHPVRGCWSPFCDRRWCKCSLMTGLVRRARHEGLHLMGRCAIDMLLLSDLHVHVVGFTAWNHIYLPGCPS
jgi:hypothetical protein